jgi:hypothetical protein
VKDYQPRFLAYMRATGATLESDAERYPGGCMAGFTIWIGQRWREWEKLTGRKSPHLDHTDFDAWLEETTKRNPGAAAHEPGEPGAHLNLEMGNA